MASHNDDATAHANGVQSGKLQIGDEWNAINIIAQSQTHPLKAVCELVENAIDAKAKTIDIVRRKFQGELYLDISDDGQGVSIAAGGKPNFDHIATHICDSFKRQLSRRQRTGIHGEFGIGLLSFWSLGDSLRMTSSGQDSRQYELVLQRGQQQYSVEPVRGSINTGGTLLVVGPLLDSTRNILTGEKLKRFLGSELRDRIRTTGVKIHINDRISRKQLTVVPRKFVGEKLEELKPIPTRFGKLLVELYVRPTADRRDAAHVAVCKDGTRVLQDITELIQLDHAPWNDGRLEGILDFPPFNLAPGTRQGVVPDERLEAFMLAVERIEPQVQRAIEQRDQAETAKANRQILRHVKRAFMTALRELPEDQYLFFDVPSSRKRSSSRGSKNAAAPGQMTLVRTSQQTENGPSVPSTKPGQLDSVLITPRNARRQPGGECLLLAKALDGQGEPLTGRVTYQWRIVEGEGRLKKIDEDKCQLHSPEIGRVVVEVEASKGFRAATDQVAVKFLDDEDEYGSARGLPSYSLRAEQGQSRRSYYDVKKNEIIINSAHRDFLSSKKTMAKHRRYIGKLYAKEVVLLNFPHESSSEAMERLIEVIVRTEDAL